MVNDKINETWTLYMELVSVDATYVDSDGNRESAYAVSMGGIKRSTTLCLFGR